MSDFESRLGEALSSGAERAPDASGLAEGARRRSRRRRTTRVVAAAAVVVAVAVPVGAIALNDRGSDSGGVADDTPVTPSDTRVETWHDVSVEVPASWGYGGRSAWCPGGDAETPVVERPGGVVPMIACTPSLGFGVTFGDASGMDPAYESGHVWQYEAGDVGQYVPGSWLGYWYDGDDLVEVNAGDKETVQAIVDSVERVKDVDANGCPVERDEGFTSDSEQLSVCRYDAGYELEQSERLSVEDTAAAIAALNQAPAGNPNQPGVSCAQEQAAYLVVDLITTDLNSAVIIQAPCPYRPGITSGGESFQDLTADVLYWALSPGWTGGLANEIPLPDPLRTLPTPEPTEQPVGAGCIETLSPATFVELDPDNGEPMSVCRYELDWDGESGGTYLLSDSSELTQQESDDVRTALEAAQVERVTTSLDCAGGPGELFVVLAGDAMPLWVYNGECGRMTAITVDDSRVPTAELLDALGSPYGLLR